MLIKPAAETKPGDLVYVEFTGGTWHLGRVKVYVLYEHIVHHARWRMCRRAYCLTCLYTCYVQEHRSGSTFTVLFHDKTEENVEFDAKDDIRAAGRFGSKQRMANTAVRLVIYALGIHKNIVFMGTSYA